MDNTLLIVGTLASCVAAFFSWLSFELGRKSAKHEQPCVGESKWFIKDQKCFVTLKIFPGHFFVQTKSIEAPGFKLSSVREFFDGNKSTPFSKNEEVEVLPFAVSIPASSEIIEVKVCVTPVPTGRIKFIVRLALKEKHIEYSCSEEAIQQLLAKSNQTDISGAETK